MIRVTVAAAPKKFVKASTPTIVRAPFRAERAGKDPGAWRDHIEVAMEDARQLGSGARVVSENGVLLAKFENAMKYVPKPATLRRPSGSMRRMRAVMRST